MRIINFTIEGYGIFHNVTVGKLIPGLTIFVGDNETGKSTCLSFIRDMFFGFRDKRTKENSFPSLAGGYQGGRITVDGNYFGEAVIERRSGKRGGLVTVVYSDGHKGTEEELHKILGNTTRELFRNVYAFSLNELQSMDTLDNESIKNVLYSAGTGTAMLSLPTAIASIETELGNLFKPGGRNPQINRKLTDLEIIRAELRNARTGIEQYNAARSALEKNLHEIEELQKDYKFVSKKKNEIETYLKLWNNWISLEDCQKELSELPLKVENFPENGIERLERNLEKLTREKDLLVEFISDNENLLKEINAICVNQKILAEVAGIKTLLDRKEGFLSVVSNLPAMNDKLNFIQKDILDILSILGKEWTEERVSMVDRSLFTREEILKHEKLLENMVLKRKEAERFVRLKDEEYEAVLTEVEQLEKEFERYRDIPEETDEKTIRALQNGRNQFASIVRELPLELKDLNEAEYEFSEIIKEISPEWNHEDIIYFDCSVSSQQKIQVHESKLERLSKQCDREMMKLDALRTDLNNIKEQHAIKFTELKSMEQTCSASLDDLEKKKSKLRILKNNIFEQNSLVSEMTYLEERLTDKKQEMERQSMEKNVQAPRKLKPLAFISIITGFAVFTLLMLLKEHTAAVVVGIIFEVIAVIFLIINWFFQNRHLLAAVHEKAVIDEIEEKSAVINNKLFRIKEIYASLSDIITESANDLGINIPVTASDIDILETLTDKEIVFSENRKCLTAEIENLNIRIRQMERLIEGQVETLEGCKLNLDKANTDRENCLMEMKLDVDLAPGTAHLIFIKIENAKNRIKYINDIKNRISIMEKTMEEYLHFAGNIPGFLLLKDKEPAELLKNIDLFLEKNREAEKRRHERKLAEEILKDKKNRKRDLQNVLNEANDNLLKALDKEKEAITFWKNWLVKEGFDSELSPATVKDAFQKIEKCIDLIQQKEELTVRIREREGYTEDYLIMARTVFENADIPVPEKAHLAIAIDKLGKELDDAKANQARREELQRKVPESESKIAVSSGKIAGIEKELDDLIKAGGALDQENFRTRGRFFSRRMELLNRISEEERALKVISGEEDLSSLKKRLKSLDNSYLKNTHIVFSEQIESLEARLNDCRQEKADLSLEISRLASSDDISCFRNKEESLLEEIRVLSKKWACYAIAKFLLNKAREKFEQEQQPKVISDAGIFFKTITEGQYEKIIAPIGENTIDVVTWNGQRKQPQQLSRGTAEQLYLAIRFGYISNFTVNGENLPIIMDDILVNFDPGRASQTAKAILELSEKHQILFFTCHPEVVGIFRGYNENIPVLTFKDGDIN